jgi:hypothetical protein
MRSASEGFSSSKRNNALSSSESSRKATPSDAARSSSRRQRATAALSSGSIRAAKTQANVKLGQQARELAALQKQAILEEKSRRPLGTRMSSRLRGPTEVDEWQQIPSDWLDDEEEKLVVSGRGRTRSQRSTTLTKPSISKLKTFNKHRARLSTGLDSDSDSELTELSDEDQEQEGEEEVETSPTIEQPDQPSTHPQSSTPVEVPETLPEGFIEWETVGGY